MTRVFSNTYRFVAIAVISVAMSVFAPGQLCAQETGRAYIYECIDVGSGLSDNHIKSVFCDSRGLIWIGTRFGVDCYDGYAVRHVQIPGRMNVPVLENSIFEDDNGDIIVGTNNGLILISPDGTVKRQVDMVLSRRLVADKSGSLLIASVSRGLRAISTSDLSVSNYPMNGSSIAVDGKGEIYQLENNGIIKHFSSREGEGKFFLKVPVKFDRIHIFREYLFVSSYSESAIYDISSGALLKSSLPVIEDICEDSFGSMFLATNNGFFIIRDGLVLDRVRDLGQTEALTRNSRTCCCTDRDGGLWIGTFNGLEHLSPVRSHLRRVDVPGNGLVKNPVVDNDGKLWLSVSNTGVFRYDPSNEKTERIQLRIDNSKILRLYPDEDYIWISYLDTPENVIRLNRKTLSADVDGSFPINVSNFLKDSKGRLWVGSLHGSGYITGDSFVSTSTSNYCTIIEDRNGAVWTGIRTIGIFRHNPDGTISKYSAEKGDFKSRRLVQMCIDDDENIWASTDGDGLFRYDLQSNSFVAEGRLPANEFGILSGLSLDASGSLLISSNNGLVRFEPSSGRWSLIPNKSVFRQSFSTRSVCCADSIIYVGSKGCFFIIDETGFLNDDKDRKILLTSFNVLPSPDGSPFKMEFDKPLNELNRITLPRNSSSFRISVTDLDYNILKTHRLVYKLEGWSKDWQPVLNGEVSFVNLPAGRYSLKIGTIGYDGALSATMRKLSIRIKPYFFASPLAFLLYAVFLAFGLLLVVRMATAKANEKSAAKLALKEAENEKNVYAAKVEFLSCIAHEIKTPLSLVKLPVESLASRFSGTKDSYLRQDIETLERNTDALGHLVDELIDLQKIEQMSFSVNKESRDVALLVEEVVDRFRRLYENKGLDFSLTVNDHPCYAFIDVSLVDKVLSNLFMNAAKYASGYVKCTLEKNENNISVVTENDGYVVPLEKRESIFKAFVRYQEGRHTVEGTGIGLYSSRKFAEMLGGRLVMDKDLTVNRFILTLPLGAEDMSTEARNNQKVPQEIVMPARFPYKILVIEDNDEMCRYIGRILEGEYDVEYASDGISALDVIASGKIPSAIISDVMMPGMDGFELCRRIKSEERTSTIPVILLTAKSGDDTQVQALESGADSYLKKPFSTSVLKAALRSVLDRNASDTGLEQQSPDNRFLLKVTDYLKTHIAESRILTEDIASYCSVSSSTLQKKMRKITGMSPAEYILKFRLKEARRLMADKNIPLSEISVLAGFSSHSYFSSCFKKEYGETPASWRSK